MYCYFNVNVNKMVDMKFTVKDILLLLSVFYFFLSLVTNVLWMAPFCPTMCDRPLPLFTTTKTPPHAFNLAYDTWLIIARKHIVHHLGLREHVVPFWPRSQRPPPE